MKQLRSPAMTAGLPERTKSPPALRECDAFEKWEGDGAGRMAMLFDAAGERSMPQLECDQQSPAIVLADRESMISGVLGNSYVV